MEEDNKGNGKEPLGKKGISDLIALMEANNKSTQKIEVDGRNTRRHLLESKKTQEQLLQLQKRVAFGFDNFSDVMNQGSLQEKEDSMDRATIFEEIRDAIRDLPQATGKATVEADNKGGPLGKFGGMLAGAGIAAAGLGVGIGLIFMSAPKLIKAFEDMDVEKIKTNVTTLLSINDEVEKTGGNMFAEGGKFFVTMAALGAGLGIFAVGGAAAAAAQKFQGDDFAADIKKNVATLLSIAELNTEDSTAVMGTLSKIGGGLVAFGIGSFFANASSDEQAQEVKKSVGTYLSIANIEDASISSADTVMGMLARIGGGLVAFGIGSLFANAASAEQALAVKTSVGHYLSISEDPNSDPAKMENTVNALKSLGGGLVGFGVGSFFANASGEGQGLAIKNTVTELLSIGGSGDIDKIDETVLALSALGAGLAAFGTGSFVGALTGAASDAINFLRGKESPIEAAINLGENADTVKAGTEAFTEFGEALDSFGNISVDFDAEEFAKSLQAATSTLEAAIIGGEVGGFLGIGDTEFVGLKNLESDINQSVAVIQRLRDVLALESDGGGTMTPGTPGGNVDGMMVQNLSAENAILRIPNQGGGGGTSVVTGGNTSSSTSNVVINQANPDMASGSEASPR